MGLRYSRWTSRTSAEPGAELSGEALFQIIWEALSDLLGTAGAAVVLRRATKRAVGKHRELGTLEISVRDLEYRCTVPSSWSEGADTPPALRALMGEVLPILQELTGRIAISRLEQIPELRGRGLLAPAGEEKTS